MRHECAATEEGEARQCKSVLHLAYVLTGLLTDEPDMWSPVREATLGQGVGKRLFGIAAVVRLLDGWGQATHQAREYVPALRVVTRDSCSALKV